LLVGGGGGGVARMLLFEKFSYTNEIKHSIKEKERARERQRILLVLSQYNIFRFVSE